MNKYIRFFVAILTLCTLFISVGCVSKTDIETLQIERQQDLKRIKELEGELAETKELLKQDIETSQSPIRQQSADMYAELQSLRTDNAKLRGEIESLGMRIDRQVGAMDSEITMAALEEQLDEIEFILENQLQVDLSKVRQERAAAQKTASIVPVPAVPVVDATTTDENRPLKPAAKEEAADVPDSDPAKALYDKAYALYKEGNYERARSYWAEFTDVFKGHPFSASALFWQGQCYFKLKDYNRATILFEDVIAKYKKSSKYKSALLRAGYSWDYLGDKDAAKMRMQEVVKKFPKSVEATQARRYLDKLK